MLSTEETTMKILRWLVAGLVWILAGVVGLVGVVLCVTIILLPLGIPVLMLARRIFDVAALLVLPRAARHPIEEAGEALKRGTKDMKKSAKASKKDAKRTGAALKDAVPDPAGALPGASRRSWLDRLLHRGR